MVQALIREKPGLAPSKNHDNLPPLLTLCALFVHYFSSNLYWTDWNREAPKIETSTVNGANRRVLVHTDIGLPNGLTFDPFSKLLCWADAGNVPKDGSEKVTLGLKGKSWVSSPQCYLWAPMLCQIGF